MLPTNIPSLVALIQQGTVRIPVNEFYIKRGYTEREIATLECLASDASKAVGRQLSDTEELVLLEYKARLIAAQSRRKSLGINVGVFTGMSIACLIPRLSRLGWLRWSYSLLWRAALGQCMGAKAGDFYAESLGRRPPLAVQVARDPRMSEFLESISRRLEEFGGHEPLLVRSWKELRRPEPPIQWFKDIYRVGGSAPRDRPPVVSHPELCWYRAWPSESEGEDAEDDFVVSQGRGQGQSDPFDDKGASKRLMEGVRGSVFVYQIADLGLKPCMYV